MDPNRNERTPGASPDGAGQEPPQEGNQTSATKTNEFSGDPVQALAKARDEAARNRIKARDLEQELQSIRAEMNQRKQAEAQAEQQRLEQQGEWQQLAEAKTEELSKLQSAHQQQISAARARLLSAELATKLADKGFTTAQAKILAPSISSALDVDWGDGFTPTADFDTAIAEAAKAFGIDAEKKAGESKPTINRTVIANGMQAPGPSNVDGSDNRRARDSRAFSKAARS